MVEPCQAQATAAITTRIASALRKLALKQPRQRF